MKAIALFILFTLTLTGCGEIPTQEQREAEIVSRIEGFNYKGHKYLLHRAYVAQGGSVCIIHDPDCPCREKGGENE